MPNLDRIVRPAFSAALGLLFLLSPAAATTHEGPTPGGLKKVGNYPDHARNWGTATLLDDSGRIFAYGTDTYLPYGGPPEQMEWLRQRASKSSRDWKASRLPLLWDPARRAWQTLARPPECPQQMAYLHTATALGDGRVLIAGGLCDSQKPPPGAPHPPHTRLSLWNGTSGTWEPAPSLAYTRLFHTATRLQDGSVLIAGGASDPALAPAGLPVLSSVERFRNGRVELSVGLSVARGWHTATLLRDGSVLVAGGLGADGKALASVEIFQPDTGTWRAAPALTTARYQHSASRLADGKLMVSGGTNANGATMTSVEIWDPATGQWSAGSPLREPVKDHATALLTNGDVLLIGGETDPYLASLPMLWHRGSQQWAPAGPRRIRERVGAVIPRADGSAQIFTSDEIFLWMPGAQPRIDDGRENYNAVATADGRVLVTGGQSSFLFHDTAVVLDPGTGRFSLTGRLNQPRQSHHALSLDDGRVVLASGTTQTLESPARATGNSPEVWDNASGTWSLLPIEFEVDERVAFGKLDGGQVLFFASRGDRGPDGSLAPPARFRAWLWNSADGAITPLPVPLRPRTGEQVAILPGGQVMLLGGSTWTLIPAQPCEDQEDPECDDQPFWHPDGDGPKAELWDVRSGTVQEIQGPPESPNASPAIMPLKGGDVLLSQILHDRSYHKEEQPPMLVWEAATGNWRALPALPAYQGWPVLELRDQTLVAGDYQLAPGARAWARKMSPLSNDTPVQLPSGQLLGVSTSSPFLALYDEQGAKWHLPPSQDTPPDWHSRPALAPMADGSLLAAGARGRNHIAYTWHPRKGAWRLAGTLLDNYYGQTAARQLPSGHVLHVGYTKDEQLKCENWDPSTHSWSACGSFPNETADEVAQKTPALGLLADGRMAMMASADHVYIYDEASATWKDLKVAWNTERSGYGAPVPQATPPARAFDPAAQAWLDISPAAVPFWDATNKEADGRWDAKAGQWTYLFKKGEKMAAGGVLLPDGCVLSWRPFRLFNPATGKVTALPDLAPWARRDDSNMAVLTDGTLVVAGSTMEHEFGFLHRKVSCNGFAGADEDRSLVSTERETMANTLADKLWWASRWLVLALVGPVLLYFVLSRLVAPLVLKVFARAEDTTSDGSETPGLSASVRRILGYVAVALVIIPIYGNFFAIDALDGPDAPASVSFRMFDKLKASFETGSLVPCRYVGVWTSSQPNHKYRVTLSADGRYRVVPFSAGDASKISWTGNWSVKDRHMVWEADLGKAYTDGPDVNLIYNETERGFALAEKDGSGTQYERIEPAKPGACN